MVSYLIMQELFLLKNLPTAIVLALCFSVSVKADEYCNCSCSELKEYKTACEALVKMDEKIIYVTDQVKKITTDVHLLQKIKKRVSIIEESMNLTGRSPKSLNENLNENLIQPVSNITTCHERIEMMCENFGNIAYRNETRKLNDDLSNLTVEVLNLRNFTAPSKIAVDFENLDIALRRVNQTIIEKASEINSLRMRVENIENNTNKRMQELENNVNAILGRIEPSKPVIVNSTINSSYTAKEDETITLVCESKASISPDKLEWFIEEINITDMSKQTNRFEERMSKPWLAFSVLEYAFQREHNGKRLRCLATVTDYPEMHKREDGVFLDILYKPETRLRGIPRDTLTEGDNLVIQCIVSANPKATVFWKKSGSSVISFSGELKFTSIKQSDSGIYKCIARNQVGESLESEVDIKVHPELCKLPPLPDPNMLVSREKDYEGNEMLVFGCKPPGKFILIGSKKPWQCVGKEWIGTVPVCRKLSDPTEVAYLADQLYRESLCESGSNDVADPTDCTAFFSCVSGKLLRKKCSGFFGEFNSVTLSCVHFRYWDCPKDTSKETARLRDFIPAIHVIPDKVNKENSRMATDDAGRLVVYKGQSFKLSCNYPDNRWGPAKWIVELLDYGVGKTTIKTSEDTNQVIVDIKDASETDSGIYTCGTPFGKFHSITVLVRVVQCVVPKSEYLRTSGRVKDLTFSIRYRCENGTEIKSFCKANGEWSKPPPTEEEC